MKTASILVYSKKGNTLGMLEILESDWFDYAFHDTNTLNPEMVEDRIKDSDVILLGAPTYYPTFQEVPEFPSYFEKYHSMFNRWKGKEIIVFGSGRSEYPLFCGAVDYMSSYLGVENTVYSYKFEGFPKYSEQKEFRKLMEGIICKN